MDSMESKEPTENTQNMAEILPDKLSDAAKVQASAAAGADDGECFALKSVPMSIMAGRYAYWSLGVAMAVWAALIPFAMGRLQVNEAQLGLLLLCLGLGAMLSMPVAGALANKFGCRAVQNVCIPVYYIALFLLSFVPTPLTLALSLAVFGAMSGTLDVVMNVQVAFLEQVGKRRLMSSLHAMYMIGVASGAGCIAILLQTLNNHILATGVVCVLILLAMLYFQIYFFPKTKCREEKTPLFTVPRGIILWFGVICFFLYMIEGVLMDWGALFLHRIRHVPLSQAGLGYALFATTMTCGRLMGDRLGARFGSKNLLFYGVLLSVVCFLAVSFIPSSYAAFAAFFCLGLFASTTVPMLFTLTTKNTMGSLGASIAAVSMLGYLGLLSGPAIMGFVAHNLGLPFVFITMSIFLCVVAGLLHCLKFKE